MPLLLIDDNFNRANTSNGGVGNGWVDPLAIWSIQSDVLTAVASSGTYATNELLRPTSENCLSEQVTADFTLPSVHGQYQQWLILRRQSNGDKYDIQFNFDSGGGYGVRIYKVVSGSPTQIGSTASFSTAPVSGHGYEITASASGASPTTITISVVDTTAGTTIASFTATDSQSGLQIAGQIGLSINDGGGNPFYVSRVRTYDLSRATLIAVNDANLFWTGNWYFNGSTFAQSTNGGAYCRVGFTGTSISVQLDTSINSGIAVYPIVSVSIDGGAEIIAQLTAGQTAIAAASGLSAGNHTLDLMILGTNRTDDRWGSAGASPANVVRITGFAVDVATGSIAITTRPKRLLYYGDSIGEGDLVFALGFNATNSDARYSPAMLHRYDRNAEVTNVSYASQGWAAPATASGNVPAFSSAWALFDNAHSRLTNGLFTSMPDEIIIALGTNDANQSISDATTQSAVTSTLTAIRAAAPLASIFVVIPPNGAKRSAITAGVNAISDARMYLIDRGSADQTGLSASSGAPTAQASDGVHPYAWESARLEAHAAALMNAAIVVSAHGISKSGGVFARANSSTKQLAIFN